MASMAGSTPGSQRASRDSLSAGLVDYERVAGLYKRGRALPPDVLHRIGTAVRPCLPAPTKVIADVGAGTGIFVQAWPQWVKGARVIAIEPAKAMALAGCQDGHSVYVRGVAESLPLGDGQLDVVWVSTALHHFRDVDRAVDEFRRVLRAGGRVLLRTYVPGRTEITWTEEFPGREKWERRLHDERYLRTLFGGQGFETVVVTDILEWEETFAMSADWVAMMRHADSMLTALSDEEVEVGVELLRSAPNRSGRIETTLLVFQRG